MKKVYSATTAWLERLNETMMNGETVSPRGQPTLELTQPTLEVNMRYPAIISPERRLSYRFMAAEAKWILTGDYRTKTITPYNGMIGQFSDDDERFFGAYGPHVVSQLPYILRSLAEDTNTRQAWLRIWQDNPPPTKDVPCTLMLGWSIRGGQLNCHAYMRSSDIWLGVPYDVFNFSIISAYLIDQLETIYGIAVNIGNLYLTAASSHLYTRNVDEAIRLRKTVGYAERCKPIPESFREIMAGINFAMESPNAFEITDAFETDVILPDMWRFWESEKADD